MQVAGGIAKGKDQEKVLCKKSNCHYEVNILTGLLRAVQFLQDMAKPDQLIAEATLVRSKGPHGQKLDQSSYPVQPTVCFSQRKLNSSSNMNS